MRDRSDQPGYGRFLKLWPHRRGLLFSEYCAFGLDQKKAADAKQYLGAIGAAQLALRVNTGSNRRGLVADKFLFDGLLRGFDLPVPDLQAVWQRPAKAMTFASLGRIDGLRRFLQETARFPLFVKSAKGSGGDGCFVITGYSAENDIVSLDGRNDAPLSEVAQDMSKLPGGALLQSKLVQHPLIGKRIGPAVGTVRIYSYFQDGKANMHGAIWRIPRQNAVTDNARSGGMIASVDLASGKVGKVRTTLTRHAEWRDTHPDTGADLTGMVLPHWRRVSWVVARAGALLHELPLIGWDIALCADGPVIVEANASPSLDGLQYVQDHGVLAGEFGQLLRQAARQNEAQNRARRRGIWTRRLAKLRKLRG